MAMEMASRLPRRSWSTTPDASGATLIAPSPLPPGRGIAPSARSSAISRGAESQLGEDLVVVLAQVRCPLRRDLRDASQVDRAVDGVLQPADSFQRYDDVVRDSL